MRKQTGNAWNGTKGLAYYDALWVRETEDGLVRIGIANQIVYLNFGLYFNEWTVSTGANVKRGQYLGVFSGAGDCEIHSPVRGRIVEINKHITGDPLELYFGWSFFDSPWPTRIKDPNYLCTIAVQGRIPTLLSESEFESQFDGIDALS